MPEIQITLSKMEAEVLLPLISEQCEEQVAFVAGEYWYRLHTALKTALQSDAPVCLP
jgi:hypothetical protein